MKFPTSLRKALVASLLLCASLLASADGLIAAEAANVVRFNPGRNAGARGKQLATLESYLLSNSVTVGLDPSDDADWKADSIDAGLRVWADALSDSPFRIAKPGQKPMIVVKFVDSIDSGGDVQGQVEATRTLHWGSSVSYQINGTLLVRRTTGRRDLRPDELTEVVAHELGHLLGLDDAQECVGLMGPFVSGRPRLKPSKEEVDAVVNYREELRSAIAKLDK
ncbi:MAG TPA: hypothetical protein VG820_02920 [Fimbriimonadaceae bacterium]|nr:hypothetical protein [Fimbriimonadaceae bacterium]